MQADATLAVRAHMSGPALATEASSHVRTPRGRQQRTDRDIGPTTTAAVVERSGGCDASSASARDDLALTAAASSSVVTRRNAGSDTMKQVAADWPGQRPRDGGGGGRAARPAGRGVRMHA